MSTESAAVAALKKRRRPRGGVARPSPEEMIADRQQDPGRPPMQRTQPFLFDPAEMPVVVESGGSVPPADFDKYYVIAEHGASQQILPDGCTTPVMRVLWQAGQHVRRDIYATWQREQEATENEGEGDG